MLPEAWEFLAELTHAVRSVHRGALLTAEDMQSDFRVIDIAGFDADWSSEGVSSCVTLCCERRVFLSSGSLLCTHCPAARPAHA